MARALVFLILLFLAAPAIAQNKHCRGLSENACRADPRCHWPFTSGYCIPNPYDPPSPRMKEIAQGVQTTFSTVFALFAFGSIAFLAWVVYKLFTEGRKPIEAFHEAEGPQRHLLAAYNYIQPISDQKHTDNVFDDLENLTKAAEHIMHARRADPNSQIVVQEKNRPAIYTIDALSFLALYEEAVLYHAVAKQGNPHAVINKDYRTLTDGPKALEAITKALRYRPESAIAWTLRGQILLSLGRTSDARAAADEALKHNPSYMPAQRLRDGI